MTKQPLNDTKESSANHEELDPSLIAVQLGVWRILLEKKSSLSLPGKQSFNGRWTALITAIQHFVPFFIDMYRLLGFGFLALFVLSHFWTGSEDALSLYYSNRLLSDIEAGFSSGKPDARAICVGLSIRLLLLVVSNSLSWKMDELEPKMRRRVKLHYEQRLMKNYLRLDLPTSKENSSKTNTEADQAWWSFKEILGTIELTCSTLSQMAFLVNVVHGQQGGLSFALLCMAKPIYNTFFMPSLWNKTYVAYSNNMHYCRSLALHSVATNPFYKQEILSGAMADYLADEYHKAKVALDNTSDDYPTTLYGASSTPIMQIVSSFLADLPLIYYALSSVMNPENFSVASLAMLQQTSSSLAWTYDRISQQKNSFSENFNKIKGLYEGVLIKNEISEGSVSFPRTDKEISKEEGMGIELRDVCFKYPANTEDRLALKNVSFHIPPSSLVVIVGSNGSGKSSIVKLLTNLYRPTSGAIVIDGLPIDSYRLSDLRSSTALLTQDHMLLPLTVSENIGIGDPELWGHLDEEDDEKDKKMERVKEAARLGGSIGFIEKFSKGWDEMMCGGASTCWASQYPLQPGPLKDALDKVEKTVDLSGGEMQRLAASRTFMRIMSGKTKLLVVDEPSSAMDPEGEYELFDRLRQMRTGKTVVFVTHRFGHLTKHANLILCMKDGELHESGTHQELMEKKDEYFKLYNIQAKAFSEDSQSSSVSPTIPTRRANTTHTQ